ncbi:MAG TPA: M28 family metallopeptidase [Candidatus Polarisedimenticolia bacterium]|nr:M28 family metallopeptidase [Candidatus Polarisedimenticolia bacterium]
MAARSGKSAALLISVFLLGSCRRNEGKLPEAAPRLMGHVRVLAKEIGPRPTGSPAEAKARRYILKSFQEAGLQAREEPVGSVRLSESSDLILDSANVVGVLAGREPRAILIGAHHDSRSSQCPGASDDASGVAVLIEASRRLASRSPRHTLIFASFTGEETQGLPGSRAFLRSWEGPPLLAAITLDFVGTGSVFVAPFPRPPELWANRLLAQAEGIARTGRVSFDPWLVIVPRLLEIPYGADHITFARAGIPSFNLSCQFPAWTYHTREDVADRVEGRTLAATADLLEAMVRKLDSGEAFTGQQDHGYVPLRLGRFVAFLPDLALRGISLAALLILAGWLAASRRDFFTFTAWSEGFRSLLLAIPFTALALSGGFGAEILLRSLTGFRWPAAAHASAHLVGALAAIGLTLWLATGIFRFIRPTSRPGVYLAMAILTEALLGGLLSAVDRHEIALPFWAGAFGMLAASRCERLSRAAACGILGVAWSLPYLSPTTFRMFLELAGFPLPPHALEVAALILALPWFLFCAHLCCFPEILLARRPGAFWSWPVGVSWFLVALGLLILNASRPSYDSDHRIVVEVREHVDAGDRKVEASLSSLETLHGVRLAGWGNQALRDSTQKRLSIPWERIDPPDLVLVKEEGSGEEIYRLVGKRILSARSATLSARSPASFEIFRDGAWETTREFQRVFLPGPEGVPEELRIRRTRSAPPLDLEAVLAYDDDLLGLRPEGKDRVFRFSSRLKLSRRFP